MKIESSVFGEGEKIPARYTCDGENINPPLTFSEVPKEAKSIVLIMDDPDATGGVTWDHWVVWNIDPEISDIEEGTIIPEASYGVTSFGFSRYGGPCPPRGVTPHRYVFQAFALDYRIDLEENSSKVAIVKAMERHIIAASVLTGYFGR